MHRNTYSKSWLAAILLSAVLFSCSEPDEVVSNLFFEDTPKVFDNLSITMTRVNGWLYDGYPLYGLDISIRNLNQESIDFFSISIHSVSPATHLEEYSDVTRTLTGLQPSQTQKPTTGYYLFAGTANQIYIGNFYVFLKPATPANTDIQVTFNVSLQYDGKQFDAQIEKNFRTLASLTPVQSFNCGENITVTHQNTDGFSPVSITITYGTVEHQGKCWLDRNLGATTRASSASDNVNSSRGWFWQFNRRQGFRYSTSRIPTTWPTTNPPGGNWSSTNDPCQALLGDGWRIPSTTDWQGAMNWSPASRSGAFSSPLRLHTPGYLTSTEGELIAVGEVGAYWATTENNVDEGEGLYLDVDEGVIIRASKPFGLSIRCVH